MSDDSAHDQAPDSAPERAGDGGARPGGDRLQAYLRPRVRVVGGAAVLGAACWTLLLFGLLASGRSLDGASTTTFALAALLLGFGVLGWSGSALVGRSVETAQSYMETGTNWTEADSRRAMARLTGAGVGAMLAVIVVTTLVGAL